MPTLTRVWIWLMIGWGVLLTACGPMTPFPSATPTASPPRQTGPTPTPTQTVPPTATPQGAPPSAVAQDLMRVEAQIRALRGVQPPADVKRIMLPPQALEAKAQSLRAASPIPNPWAWQALDLIPPNYDLKTALTALPTPPLALYVPAEGVIYFTAPQGTTGPLRLAYAYAYAQALQPRLDPPAACQASLDCDLALQALTAGDALYTAYLWFFAHATPQDLDDIAAFYNTTPTPPSLPLAVEKQRRFAYDYGYPFIQFLFQQNGWASIAQAFAHPPVSTEQILVPEAYPADRPETFSLPQARPLGPRWEEAAQGEFGAWLLYLMLTASQHPEARLSASEALDVVRGWGGGAWAVFRQPDTHTLALVADLRWDSNDATVQFVKVFVKYARGRFGPLLDRDRGYRTLSWETDTGAAMLYYNTGAHRAIFAFAPTRAEAKTLVQWLASPGP